MRRPLAPAAAFAAVLLLCPTAQAGSPTEQLRSFFGAAARILDPETQEKPEERFNAIRGIVREIVDFREAARLALGSNWSVRTAAEREEFVPLFADLLEGSLIVGIAARIRLPDGVKVSYLGESVDGAMATVRTTIVSRTGLDLPFKYQMIERGERWAVRDVVIDGMSVAANYRAQFMRVMHAASYPELVRQMRARVSRTPKAPVVVTALDTGVPIGPILPALPSRETARQEPTEPTSPQRLAATDSDPHREEDVAMGGCSPSCPPREPIPTVPLPLERMVRPRNSGQGGSPKEEPVPATAPGETRHQTSQRQPVVALVSARPSNATSYWVQVGAFKNPEAARRLASLLLDREAPVARPCVIVVEGASADTMLVRVRVGPFSDRSEAVSKLREIQARGHKPFIAEERGPRPPPVPCAIG
jgi:phospholipid transport system substrate-binding protein